MILDIVKIIVALAIWVFTWTILFPIVFTSAAIYRYSQLLNTKLAKVTDWCAK